MLGDVSGVIEETFRGAVQAASANDAIDIQAQPLVTTFACGSLGLAEPPRAK